MSVSMFGAISKFVQTTFNTATSSLGTVEKGIDIANHYVEQQHKKITRTNETAAQLAVAAFNDEVALQLNASESLKAQFEDVVANW